MFQLPKWWSCRPGLQPALRLGMNACCKQDPWSGRGHLNSLFVFK